MGRIPPHIPTPLLHPEPWEVTHCGWGWCGPSQTPSTVNPLENSAPRPASIQRPRCLGRGMVLGPTQARRPSPSLGEDQGWQIPLAPFSNSPCSWSPPASVPVRLCRLCTVPLWGSPLTQRTMWKLQCAWQPLRWAEYMLHTSHLETEEEWKFLPGLCTQLLLMRTHFGFPPGCLVPLGVLFPKVCDSPTGGAHTWS